MKLVSTLVSLLTATLILPFALSSPLPQGASESMGSSRAGGVEAVEHVPTTNAERFARGLPPLSPSKSRRRGSPTRRDSVSPVPATKYQGYISVYQDGSLVGYLAKADSYIAYWTNTDSEKLLVSFTLPAGQSIGSGLNLRLENAPQSVTQSTPYLGLGSGSKFDHSFPYASFTPTVMTSGGPSVGDNAMRQTYIESDIWSVNVQTGDLIPGWTTASGAVATNLMTYEGTLFLGDDEKYTPASAGTFIHQGTFKFVPQ